MSAINPASFASPTLGITAPSGVGIGAVSVGRGSAGPDRRPHQQQAQQQEQSQANYSSNSQMNRGFQPPAFSQAFAVERPSSQGVSFQSTAFPPTQFGTLGLGRPLNFPYAQNMPLPSEGMTGGPDFTATARGRFQQPPPNMTRLPAHGVPASSVATPADWAGAFQGLPMNSR